MEYNPKTRLKAMEWWNSLSLLDRTNKTTTYYKDGVMPDRTAFNLSGREIELVWESEGVDAKEYKRFEDFRASHPYKHTRSFTEDDWELHLLEIWMERNEHVERLEEIIENPINLLYELWQHTVNVHPYTTKNCQNDSLFGRISNYLKKNYVPSNKTEESVNS